MPTASQCYAGFSAFSNRARFALKPFPTTGRRFLIHHLHVPRLTAKPVVCVLHQVREVIDDLWGKRNTSINLQAPQHHCCMSTRLLEPPKWKPAAPFRFPVRQTNDPRALKGSNPGKYYTETTTRQPEMTSKRVSTGNGKFQSLEWSISTRT